MTEDDLKAIEAQLASDGYGTMCKACTDRLRQCVAEIRRLREPRESGGYSVLPGKAV